MSTQSQIDANRRNAALSTGPVTESGLAVSRFNALKTGIHAKSQVIPGEDPAELEQLAAGYHQQFQPATPEQRFLVDTLVNADWLLRRYHKVEAQLWALASEDPNPTDNLAEIFERRQKAFSLVHRKIAALERSYYRAHKELKEAQAPADNAKAMSSEERIAALASFCAPPNGLIPVRGGAILETRPPLENPALRL